MGEPVDLVGHDWGSFLVQRVVSIRPDLIRTWAAGGGAVDRDYVWHDLAQMWQTPEVGEQIMAAMVGRRDGRRPRRPSRGRENAAIVASHIDDTMKDCILKLYRSASVGFAEWHDAVDAIRGPVSCSGAPTTRTSRPTSASASPTHGCAPGDVPRQRALLAHDQARRSRRRGLDELCGFIDA